jgi:hypothetical protein
MSRPKNSFVAPVRKNEEEKMHHKAMHLKDIPESTHRTFKTACANHGVTMRDAQIILMRRFSTAVNTGEDWISIDKMKPEEADKCDENKA